MGNIIKGFFSKVKTEDGGKRKNIVIILIIIAILFLAFGDNIFGTGAGEEESKILSSSETDNYEQEVLKMEQELEEILSLIHGAGEVRVKIDIEKREERVVAKDTKTKNQNEIKGDDTKTVNEIEESIVTYGQGGGEEPIIISEKGMRPSGVLIVASGAKDEKVKNEIFEAVRALYGLSAHRVTVAASD